MSNVSGISAASPELALAEMMIESDFQLSQADREAMVGARKAERAAMKDELEAKEDEASAIRSGAILQGSLTIAGGSLAVGAEVGKANGASSCKKLEIAGQASTDLAGPFGKFFGDAAAKDAEHDATAAEQAQEQAKWIADDADKHADEADKHSEAMMQQVQDIIDTQHSATIAVLSNF
ncbi:MAG TPA: hypothetical protein VGP93_02680 [Polyangiaceae bacterium]|jgi:hypothetical protein|nr:hypothetical protein [Polyangiaceae bacterium]